MTVDFKEIDVLLILKKLIFFFKDVDVLVADVLELYVLEARPKLLIVDLKLMFGLIKCYTLPFRIFRKIPYVR